MDIEALYKIATKPVRKIIGLMSGTSFDGLDIALCEFEKSGLETNLRLLQFKTAGYSIHFKEELKSVFSKKTADLEKITLLHVFIGNYFGRLVLESIHDWRVDASEVDLIASHGQTIFHAPKWSHPQSSYNNATLQIGDGDQLAFTTGIITISDFRQKHIAAGGEGAPLAMYGDFLMFSSDDENRVMLNIGGIANFTFLPAGRNAEKVFSTDTGPGNTMIDQFVQLKYPGTYYDKDAMIAGSGTVNESLLKALLDHPFFSAALPKTSGPELFNLSYLEQAVARACQEGIADKDVLATLTFFSAETIIRAIEETIGEEGGPFKIYLSGGGMHNPLLIRHLEEYFNEQALTSTASLGIDPDAKEAVLFAVLANEAVARERVGYGSGQFPSVSMGKVSFPN